MFRSPYDQSISAALAGGLPHEGNVPWSKELSFSRLITPYLSDGKGSSTFLDCDIAEILTVRDDDCAVMCIRHDFTLRDGLASRGRAHAKYEKKNWSTPMMFSDEKKCRVLHPDRVNAWTGFGLHQFKRPEIEELIGAPSLNWSFLIDVDEPRENAALIHDNEGGPSSADSFSCDYAEDWKAALARTTSVAGGA